MMQFQPGHSLMHRLHPLAKVCWLLWGTVAVFVFDSAVFPWIVAGLAVGLLWLSGVVPWRSPGIRVWVILGMAIVAAHTLAVPQGRPGAEWVTSDGLISGLRVAARLLAVILMSTLFVVTTDPVSLACALMRIGLPYRWGFAMVTALRLAPIFRLKAHHVYQAQRVRGVAYDAAGPRKWWLILRHLCLPMLVSALRSAHLLSLSMEGRAFGLHPQRTYSRRLVAHPCDIVAGLLLGASILVAVW
jgi:energy-coupling factor transport system permease protein